MNTEPLVPTGEDVEQGKRMDTPVIDNAITKAITGANSDIAHARKESARSGSNHT
jgi:hypothetical protein